MNDVVHQTISSEHSVLVTNVEVDGTCSRSAWFPTHGYDGLLYRENEHAIVIREVGENSETFEFF